MKIESGDNHAERSCQSIRSCEKGDPRLNGEYSTLTAQAQGEKCVKSPRSSARKEGVAQRAGTGQLT